MSDRSMLELKIDRTRSYAIHKGRLPKDTAELYEWLNEFTEFLQLENRLLREQILEHANICNRPFVLQRVGQ